MIKLKELRKNKQLTQEELISQFNIRYGRKYTAAAISQFENGKRIPETQALMDFADFFNVSVDYLLGRTDEPQGTGFQKGDGGNEAVAEKEVKTVKPKAYVELHRLIDELPHSDVEELLNTAIFKKKKAEQAHEHVDDPDDF